MSHLHLTNCHITLPLICMLQPICHTFTYYIITSLFSSHSFISLFLMPQCHASTSYNLFFTPLPHYFRTQCLCSTCSNLCVTPPTHMSQCHNASDLHVEPVSHPSIISFLTSQCMLKPVSQPINHSIYLITLHVVTYKSLHHQTIDHTTVPLICVLKPGSHYLIANFLTLCLIYKLQSVCHPST